jgi:hypothetical protein
MKVKKNPKESPQPQLPRRRRRGAGSLTRPSAAMRFRPGPERSPRAGGGPGVGISAFSLYEWQRKFRLQIDDLARILKTLPGLEEEIERLREALHRSPEARGDFKKEPGHFCRRPGESFAFLATLIEHYPLALLCQALDLSPSGYHAWKLRPPSPRAQTDRQLATEIALIHARSRRTYGSPRVRQQLRQQGRQVGRRRVARLITPTSRAFEHAENRMHARQTFATRAAAELAIFDYIETFYNPVRLHSALQFRSPRDFEILHPPNSTTLPSVHLTKALAITSYASPRLSRAKHGPARRQ